MENAEPVLFMNVDGVLYPVGMTADQAVMIKLFIASISKDKPFTVLKRVPIMKGESVEKQIEEVYGVKLVKDEK